MRDCEEFGRDDLLDKCKALRDAVNAGSIEYKPAQDELNGYLRELHPPLEVD